MNSLSTALRTGRSLVRFGGERSAVRFSTVPAVEEAPATSNAPQREKKTRHTKIHVPKGPHNVHDAVEIVKAHSWASFNESFDIVVNTGLDPRKPNQNVKGIAKLPNGRGNKVRVCVIAQADDAEKARMAGADVAGADDVIALIQSGDVNFNAVIATPEMMASVGKIGRVSNNLIFSDGMKPCLILVLEMLWHNYYSCVFFVLIDFRPSRSHAQSQDGYCDERRCQGYQRC